MKARKRFPISVKCKHCDGHGSVMKTRPVKPCWKCKHDVHFEHLTTSVDIRCMIDGCDCRHELPRDSNPSWERGEWPHP